MKEVFGGNSPKIKLNEKFIILNDEKDCFKFLCLDGTSFNGL